MQPARRRPHAAGGVRAIPAELRLPVSVGEREEVSASPRALHQLARGLGVSVEELAARSGAQVDIVGAPLAAAADEHSPAAVSDALVWHDNPAWSSPADTDAERTSASPGAGHSELAQAHAEVLPALRRLLAGYSLTTRVALLAELQSGAVADLTADQ